MVMHYMKWHGNSTSPYNANWNTDYAHFANQATPFFIRGGSHSNETLTGIFAFYCNSGEPSIDCSFRPVFAAL